jgi:AcrR family transcriptional regulator
MGIKERREREKQVTRQAILTAALEIARQEGWLALTIRKIGERIEYSAPMVYQYFENKEAVLQVLLQEGFQRLTVAMQQARASTEDRERNVLRMADAYWQFAITNPEIYQLMNGQGNVQLDRNVIGQMVQEVCALTEDALVDWAQEQGIRLDDPLGVAEIVWSLLHGLVSLHLVDRVGSGEEQKARELMHQALRNQLAGWKVNAQKQG